MATKLNVNSPRLVVQITQSLKRKVARKCKKENTYATSVVNALLDQWVKGQLDV